MSTGAPPLADVYLGLGANLGERRRNLAFGINFLKRNGIEVIRCSSLYLTEPVGMERQPDFLNQVIQVRTGLNPAELLAVSLRAEAAAGRIRLPGRVSRVLDVDLLLYGSQVCRGPGVRLPHPRLHLRRFVLVPLAEIAPDARHPGLQQSVAEILSRCEDRSRVARLPGARRLVPGRPADL